MSAHAIIEKVGAEKTLKSYIGGVETGWQSYTARCSECDFAEYSMVHAVAFEGVSRWALKDHLPQHDPGRAVDIEPYYEVHAYCSVCDDGGDVHADGDCLTCYSCGTMWDMDGKNGETVEH